QGNGESRLCGRPRSPAAGAERHDPSGRDHEPSGVQWRLRDRRRRHADGWNGGGRRGQCGAGRRRRDPIERGCADQARRAECRTAPENHVDPGARACSRDFASTQGLQGTRMMSFINSRLVELSRPLKAAYFPFSRAQDLSRALSWCVTDYATKASIGQLFEARGVLVIGESRQGKSREIQRFRDKFNGGSEIMPDGRPARIVHCILSGKVTWKDLGVKVLSALGYPLKGRNTQAEIWVVKYAELQGVVGIHFDECQHVFS